MQSDLLYVVTKRMGRGVLGGKDAVAVFREPRECERYQKENGGEIEPRIVIGKVAEPGKVFVASEYHSGSDLFWFLGLYGNFDLAEQAAGEPNEVRSIEPQ